jgi:hypothetical protein
MRRALALLALLAGCSSPRTEVVLTVHTSGVRVPDDVDSLRLRIADRTATAGDDQLFDQPVPLCSDGAAASNGCYALPITVTMYPGSMRPNDSVRVQVDAERQGAPVIANAALFTFSEGHSLRLDVILYANCLGNTSCALRDQACGPDASCQGLTTTPLGEEPDLAPPDLTMPTDGPPPIHDFTVTPDSTIPDLVGVDLVNCVPQCGGKNCGFDGCNGICGPCSGLNQYCDPSQQCVGCGFLNAPCCPPGGLAGGCDPMLFCDINNMCTPLPDMTMPPPDLSMPPPDLSMPPFDMTPPPFDLTMCGYPGQPCCNGTGCFVGVCNFPDCVGAPMDLMSMGPG